MHVFSVAECPEIFLLFFNIDWVFVESVFPVYAVCFTFNVTMTAFIEQCFDLGLLIIYFKIYVEFNGGVIPRS